MNLSILLSSGGEAGFVGLVIGLLCLLVSFLYNVLKPKVQEATANIKVGINPNDVNSLIKKGYSAISKKEYSQAINCFERAIKNSPNNLDALAGIALTYHLEKDYIQSKTTIKEYQRLVSADSIDNPMTGIMTYLYGHHLFMEGNIEEAKVCKENAKIITSLSNTYDIMMNLNLY